jgi:copper chaperone
MNITNRKPLIMFGLMVIAGIMVGAMIVIMFFFSKVGDMGQLMFGTNALGMMIIPLVALVIMVLIMVFFFRKMMGKGGPMRMMGVGRSTIQHSDDDNLTVLNYEIPGVSCAHCKATIEQEVGKLPGVASVNVDVDSRQAIIKLISPPTNSEIEALLTKIGYAPDSQ